VTGRKIAAAVVVMVWCVFIALFIKWRSAPPPPPAISIPGGAASP